MRPASTSSSAPTPDEFRPASFRGQHPSQKKQIAGLHRFRVGAKRLRRRRELDAKFFQPLLGAGRPRAFASYHLPACAPPSTCNISPVVKVASIKNKTASTTSLTSPILPTGCNPLRNSWVSGLCIGVLMGCLTQRCLHECLPWHTQLRVRASLHPDRPSS